MKTKIILLPTLLLIINITLIAQTPEWQWAAKAGGTEVDGAMEITIDNEGNTYVTGFFKGTANFGSYSLTSSGEHDIYVAKMDPNGNWLWATKAGGISYDGGNGITIDNEGNIYVTGHFSQGTATFGSYSLTCNSNWAVYVAKMDPNGNWLWATKADGSFGVNGAAIKVDDEGNTYVTGSFQETANFGSYSITSSGGKDIFVAKMDSCGNWLWATKSGGDSGDDAGYGITIDNDGNSCITGKIRGAVTFGDYSLIGSLSSIFVAKIDMNGNWLWATKAGGPGVDDGMEISKDNNGNYYVTGSFENTTTFASYSLTSDGDKDIFIAKIDMNGNWLWATKAGGSHGNDVGRGITTDNDGNSYITGYFNAISIFGSYVLTSNSIFEVFVAKMDVNGNWLWAIKADGNDAHYAYGIAIDDLGNSYVTGTFRGIATFGSYSFTSSGSNDIFIAKLNSSGSSVNETIPNVNSLTSYPNPFTTSTTIEFELQQVESVQITIYNHLGKQVKLIRQNQSSGKQKVSWDAAGLPSGVYCFLMQAGNQVASGKLVKVN